MCLGKDRVGKSWRWGRRTSERTVLSIQGVDRIEKGRMLLGRKDSMVGLGWTGMEVW